MLSGWLQPSMPITRPVKPEFTPPRPRFRYNNCLSSVLARPVMNIHRVTFDISRYGKKTHTIHFKEPVAQHEAIRDAEEFLSQPLTEEYYNTIKNDLFDKAMPWEHAKGQYEHRGACLTDARFLEFVELINGTLTLFCGS